MRKRRRNILDWMHALCGRRPCTARWKGNVRELVAVAQFSGSDGCKLHAPKSTMPLLRLSWCVRAAREMLHPLDCICINPTRLQASSTLNTSVTEHQQSERFVRSYQGPPDWPRFGQRGIVVTTVQCCATSGTQQWQTR